MAARILLIDDEAHLRRNLQLLLRSEGYEVLTAVDGEEGIQRLQAEQFDLVITDVMMGKVSGFDILEYVVTHRPATPVILLTGYASRDSAQKALSMGAYEYLAKPFEIKSMLAATQKALEERRLRQQKGA